jgi:hypothetical protein
MESLQAQGALEFPWWSADLWSELLGSELLGDRFPSCQPTFVQATELLTKPLDTVSFLKHRKAVLGWELLVPPSTQQGSVTIFGYPSPVMSQCWNKCPTVLRV